MSNRDAFEKALSDRYPPEHFMRFEPDGDYVEPAMRHRYEGWLSAELDHANRAKDALAKARGESDEQ